MGGMVKVSGMVNWAGLEPKNAVNQFVSEGRLSPEDLYEAYLNRGQERGLVLGVGHRITLWASAGGAGNPRDLGGEAPCPSPPRCGLLARCR